MLRSLVGAALVASVALVAVACGGGGASPTPAGATAVSITLQEWAVGSDKATVPAGAINFAVTNQGPDDTHEFVVIKTDLSLISLPTDATGKVDEEGGGMVVEGEIEDILVGTSENLPLTLDAGAYALICNIYTEAENEAHYSEGMRTSFTVTE